MSCDKHKVRYDFPFCPICAQTPTTVDAYLDWELCSDCYTLGCNSCMQDHCCCKDELECDIPF